MFYGLQHAADMVGVNKSTVLRAIQAGKVPATRNKRDQWLIEPAELRRVYPPAAAGNRNVKRRAITHQSELAEANRHAALWRELKVGLLRHALALLSHKKYGCTTTMLSARGVKIETIHELIADGFATASTKPVGNGAIEIKRIKITEAGRQVLLQRVAR
jgi:excisionase family DNA binding protein